MNEHVAANRALWNARMRAHLDAGLYPIDTFHRDGSTLGRLEIDEIGPVDGKRLLHLQCNGGLDTLSWARRGAVVTGVDFSSEAIRTARLVAATAGLDATFVETDLYDTCDAVEGPFDIVYTSAGVLWWLPDLDRWAEIIAAMLRPGGMFYIQEIHPFAMTLTDDDATLTVGHDYFGNGAPIVFESTGTYYEAPPGFAVEAHTESGWVHPLSEIVTTLATAGLRIEYLREHPFSFFRMLSTLELGADDYWHPPPGTPPIPLIFSLRASRS